MSESFILCDNLVKIYKLLDDVEVLALQGLELEIERGEMVGVVGASGSGKSTLLNVLGGLVRPTAGGVFVNGQALLKLSTTELDQYRREQVGFVWQQSSRNLIPYLSALENVEYPMTLAGRAGRHAQSRAKELLDLVGLSERMDHRPNMLSGGEQARVAIAIALANDPTLLLADEPTGELDSVTSALIYDYFKTLNRELGLTTLIVSHDPGIARHVDRVIAIRDGKLAGETVRANTIQSSDTANNGSTGDEDTQSAEEELFEELIVLDSAGRLQIPKDMREEMQIGRRVMLERTPDGVLIRPIVKTADAQREDAAKSNPQTEGPDEPEQNSGTRSWTSFWRR